MRHALYGAAVMSAVFALFNAFASEPQKLPLTEEQALQCQAEGGCVVISYAALQKIANEMQRLRSLLNKSCA